MCISPHSDQLRMCCSNDTPVAMSTQNTHILISNTVLQQKESGLLEEMVDPTNRIRNIQMSPEHPGSARK